MVELDRGTQQVPVPVPGDPTTSPAPRRRCPALWWASPGAVADVLRLSIYLRCVMSPDFHRVGTGADPVPPYGKALAWVLQSAFGTVALPPRSGSS